MKKNLQTETNPFANCPELGPKERDWLRSMALAWSSQAERETEGYH